jgi:hypothetical protein
MKNPLNYQFSEYDCVPTTFLNALNYIFGREAIPPEVIKAIMLYSLDTFNRNGEVGKNGTSGFAVPFICEWLNNYSKTKNFNVSCSFIKGRDADIDKNRQIIECIEEGGVVLASVVYTGVLHSVLITNVDERYVYIFDPYFRKNDFNDEDIEKTDDNVFEFNRKVTIKRFNSYEEYNYAMGDMQLRGCVLMKKA